MTDRLKAQMLAALDGAWLALHYAPPGTGGAFELIGGGYARRPAKLDAAIAGERSNLVERVTFSDLPGETVTHAALWDSPSGGACLWPTALTAPITLSPGDGLEFAPRELAFALVSNP